MTTDEAPLAATGKPVNKLWGVCMYILIVEMMERLCFYTIYPTFPQYLNHAGKNGKGMAMSGATALKLSFRMLAYLFPLAGGYLADNVFGRYRTILYFTICYVIGTAMIAIGAINQLMEGGIGLVIFLLGAFVFTAIGTGAIKPNVVNFGAEQYDPSDPREADQQKAFFSYFYMTINIGSIFASIWLAGLATSQVGNDTAGSGFFFSYLVAAVAMALSLLAFLIGTPKYSSESKAIPQKKPMVSIIRKHLIEGAGRDIRGTLSLLGILLVPVYLLLSLVSSLLPASVSIPQFFSTDAVPGLSLLQLIVFVLAVLSSALIIGCHINNDWIQELSTGQGAGVTTEEVRGFFRAIPTILCVTIGFNLCYGGMDIYQIQACQMDTQTHFPDALNSFFFLKGQFNGVFYGLGNNAAIIVCIPLFENVVFPALKRCRGGRPIPRTTKFNVGFFFTILGCVAGIAIETLRKQKDFVLCPAGQEGTTSCFESDGEWLLVSQCAPTGVPMSAMSAWWTFIPYWLTGMGEILVNPVVQEFAFDEVSPSLKSMLMGVTMVVTGCIPAAITGAISGFIPNNLNNGNVSIVYIVFIVLALVLLVVYWFIALPEKVRGQIENEGSLAGSFARQ